MFERFTGTARRTVVLAQQEARALNHRWIGTEHLLLGLTQDDGIAGHALADATVTAETLRAAITTLVGTERLDGRALRTLGIDLDDVRRSVERSFGDGALERPTRPTRRRWFGRHRPEVTPTRRIPFTRRSKKALELALREAERLQHRHIGTEHLLLGILREGGGLGARVLTDLGVDLRVLRASVLDRLRTSA